MFDLDDREKKIIVLLLSALILGLGFSAYKKSHPGANVRLGRFVAEKEDLSRKININTAGQDEIAALKGIGAVLAGRIVEYRSGEGQFVSIEDIKKVKGVGRALFDKIKDDITVE